MSYSIGYSIGTSDTVCSAIQKIDNEIRNVIFPALNYLATRQANDTPPPSPQPSEMWFDTNTNELKVYAGGTWKLYNKVEISGAGTTKIINFSNTWDSANLKQQISFEVEFKAPSPSSWIDPLDPTTAPLRIKTTAATTGIWKHGIYADLTHFYIKPGDGKKVFIVGDETNDNVLHHLHQDGTQEPYALLSDVTGKQVYTQKIGEYNYIRIPKINLPVNDRVLFPMAHGFIEVERLSSQIKVIYGFYIRNTADNIQAFLLSADTVKDADYFYIRLPSFKRLEYGIPSPYQLIQLTKGATIVSSAPASSVSYPFTAIYAPQTWLYESRDYTLADATSHVGGKYYINIPMLTQDYSFYGIGDLFTLEGWSVPNLEYLDRFGNWQPVASAMGLTDLLINAEVTTGTIRFRFDDTAGATDYVRVYKYRIISHVS